MKQRAHRVELNPQIEQACLKDLGMHCSDTDDPGVNQVSGPLFHQESGFIYPHLNMPLHY